MRQWKIAISLAIVGVVAAPFVFGTWKVRPRSEVLVPLTAEEKERITAYMERTENCEKGIERSRLARFMCEQDQEDLQRGAKSQSYLSVPKYLAINIAAALIASVGIYGLVFLVPALVRRYWKWLNT